MDWTLLSGLFVGAAVSGVVPLVNAELLVAGAAVLVGAPALPLVALVVGAGQMLTKSLLYGLARWAPARLPGRARRRLDRAAANLTGRGRAVGTMILASALLGIPPFYGVSLAAGAVRVPVATYLVPGAAGRWVRFALLAWLAHAGRTVGGLLASSPSLPLPWFPGS